MSGLNLRRSLAVILPSAPKRPFCLDSARLPLSQFREALKAWAHQQGVKQPVADKTLKRKLEGLGYEVSKVHGYPTIFGLDLTIPI